MSHCGRNGPTASSATSRARRSRCRHASRSGSRSRSDLARLRRARTAPSGGTQHQRHHDVDAEQLDLRQECTAAERTRPTISAPSAAPGRLPRPPMTTTANASTITSTPIAGHHRERGRGERAAERPSMRADDEGDQIDARDVDAHRDADLAVVDHREQELALPRAVEHPRQRRADDDGDHDQRQVVDREGQAGRPRSCRAARRAGKRSTDSTPQTSLITSSRISSTRVGDEHHHDLVAAVHEAQQAALDQRPRDEADDERPRSAARR